MQRKPNSLTYRSLTKSILLGATFASAISTVACQSTESTDLEPEVRDQAATKAPRFAKGNFGRLHGVAQGDVAAIRTSAREVLQSVLVGEFRAAGNEVMIAGKVSTDNLGGVHVRFTQEINGMDLEGAGMVLHALSDGTVVAANGDVVDVAGVPSEPSIDPLVALNDALVSAQINEDEMDDPELSYVLGTDGQAHLAWRATVDYRTADGPQRDVVFADAATGKLVARHPQFHYALSMETIDANNSKSSRKWRTISTSSSVIDTGDDAIDSAHNYAIATYNYYATNHGRDSIDDNGMTLISRAHWDRNYNNAYWDGTQMTYGDGDGTTFIPLSQDADVVAHELTHGVTERSSGMIYQNESGALNEAWSDIFGAMVDMQEGATGADIWLLGEDIYTPAISGDGLRNMADPEAEGDYDYYPTRYTGTSDNGGVHSNSGIANLAFVLLADGGTHPRSKTSVVVPSLGADIAADLFYEANVNCLTPNATFAEARFCTAEAVGGAYAAEVHLAWDAVGVPTEYTPPPEPSPAIPLDDGVTLSSQDSNESSYQTYFLANVAGGDTVECTTTANNGDADLYLRFDAEPEANPNSSVNECGSYSSTSNEGCTTGAAPDGATLNALVHAYNAYTSLSIACTSTTPDTSGPNCSDAPYDFGCSCTANNQCASNSCKGRPGNKICK